MSKQSDDNLDKNSQKQTPFFLYDGEQKLSWINPFGINPFVVIYLIAYAVGFPPITLNGQFLKFIKFLDFDFLELGEKKYNEITESQVSQCGIYIFLGFIPCLIFASTWLLFLFKLYVTGFSNFFFHDNDLNYSEKISFLRSYIILCFLMIFLIGAIQLIYMRLLFRVVEYLIPETLCLMQIINLNIELTRDDVIYRRDVKSMVLFRMDYLARVTMLIPLRYSIGKPSNQKWIQQHFQNISYYIRERRRWLIAPNETTLDDLRRDFRKLAYFYLTGKYGAWEWQSFELPTEVIKQTRFQKIQVTLIRFFGIALPLFIMAFFIIFSKNFPDHKEILNNLPYIFIAWLLVCLDITLKLGVIESLTKLITGLKDLSK